MADKKIKGITIQIQGETTGLDKALGDINRKSKSLQSELVQVDRLLKLDPTNTELMAQKQKLLAEQVELSTQKVDALRQSQEQVDRMYQSGDIDDGQYRKFERDVIAADQSLKKYSAQADEAGDDTKKAGKEADKAGDEAKTAGDKWSGMGAAMGAAAKAGAVAVAAVGTAAVAATAALADCSKEGAVYADNMLTLSAQTGIAVDELQKYNYVAELVDVSTETMTKSMAKNIKQMTSTSKDVQAAYSTLGVAVTNADGTLRNSQDVYWECIDALGQIEDETTRDSIAMQIFGKSAQDLNPLIERGAQGLKELTDQAEDMGAVLSGKALEAYGAYSDNLDTLTSAAGAAKRALGLGLLPTLTDLSGAGVDILGELTTGLLEADGDVDKIGEVITDVLEDALTAADEILPDFFDLGAKILSSIANALVKSLPKLISSSADIINMLLKNIIGGLPDIVKAGAQLLESLIKGIADNLPMIVESTMEVIDTLIDSAITLLPMLLTLGLQILTSLMQGISESLPELIPTITDVVLTMVEILIDNIPLLIECAGDLLIGLTEGIIAALPVIIEHAPEIITAIVGALIDSLPILIECGVDLIGALIDGIIEATPQIIAAIGDMFTSMIDEAGDKGPDMLAKFEDIGADIYDIQQKLWADISSTFDGIIESVTDNVITPIFDCGKDILHNLWDGILSAKDWFTDNIGGFFSEVGAKIGGFFGFDVDNSDLQASLTGGSGGRRDSTDGGRSTNVTVNQTVNSPRQLDALEMRKASQRAIDEALK